MSPNKYQLCRVCGKVETKTVFNIDFRAVPVCQGCSRAIFIQEAQWLCNLPVPKEVKGRKIIVKEKKMDPIIKELMDDIKAGKPLKIRRTKMRIPIKG